MLLGALALLTLGALAPASGCGSSRPDLHQGAGHDAGRLRLERRLCRHQRRLGYGEPLLRSDRSCDRRRGLPQHVRRFRRRPARLSLADCLPGCSVSKRQGDWASLKGSNVSLITARNINRSRIDDVRTVHRPGRLRLEHRAVVFQGRRGRRRRSQRHPRPTARCSQLPPATTAGAAPSVPASNSPSHRTGRPRSNTTTCSSPTTTPTSPTPPAALSSVQRPYSRRCRSGVGPRQLPLGRPGRRKILIASEPHRISKRPASCRLFCCLLLTAAAIFVILTRFLHANRYPLRLKTVRSNNPLMVFTRHWKLIPVLPMFRALIHWRLIAFRRRARTARLRAPGNADMDEIIKAEAPTIRQQPARDHHSRRARTQSEERRRRNSPRQARGVHGTVGLRQILARLRHHLCRRPAALRRVAVGLCAPVPGDDAEARCRPDRRAVAGDLDRTEDHVEKSALDRRHRHRDLRLHAPVVGARRRALFAGHGPADRKPDRLADGRSRAGAARGHAALSAGAGRARPQGRIQERTRRISQEGIPARQDRRHLP